MQNLLLKLRILSIIGFSGLVQAMPSPPPIDSSSSYRVESSNQFVRSGPSLEFPPVMTLDQGSIVQAKAIEDSHWAKIKPGHYISTKPMVKLTGASPDLKLQTALAPTPLTLLSDKQLSMRLAVSPTRSPSNIQYLSLHTRLALALSLFAFIMSTVYWCFVKEPAIQAQIADLDQPKARSWRIAFLKHPLVVDARKFIERRRLPRIPKEAAATPSRENKGRNDKSAPITKALSPATGQSQSDTIESLMNRYIRADATPRVHGMTIGMNSAAQRLVRFQELSHDKKVQSLPVMRLFAHLERHSDLIIDRLNQFCEDALERPSLQKDLVSLQRWSKYMGLDLRSELSFEAQVAMARFKDAEPDSSDELSSPPYQLLYRLLSEVDVVDEGSKPTQDIAFELSALPDDYLAAAFQKKLKHDECASILPHLPSSRFALHLGLMEPAKAKSILRSVYLTAGQSSPQRARDVVSKLRGQLKVKDSSELHGRTHGYLMEIFESFYPKQ